MSKENFRLAAPPFEEIKSLKLIHGEKILLNGNLPLYSLNAGTSEVLRFEIFFDAGGKRQHNKAIAYSTNAMLTEGTSTKNSEQIALGLDYFGAYLQTRCTADESSVTLYCLKKHFISCLPFLIDIIQNSIFPDDELAIFKMNSIQRLMVNLERNSFLAKRAFYSTIFGPSHPYGSFSEPTDYEFFSRENLLNFYQTNYVNKIKFLFVSGYFDKDVIRAIENSFSGGYHLQHEEAIQSLPTKPQKVFIEKEGSIQSAIRIGRPLFNRNHPDYFKFQLLNLILGGYFGSRLMKKIREEKGFTYGIYSSVESYLSTGCFFIETEINNDKQAEGIEEIYHEIARLCNEDIPTDELILAKNYLLGSFIRSIDGPFSLAERYKILIDFGLDYTYYDSFIDVIRNVTSKEMNELANKYFTGNVFSEISVGKA